MRNVKMLLQYVGTAYAGWQFQTNNRSIQEVLQRCLSQILGEKITVIGSGRTDSGVHALAQVANFRTSKTLALPLLQKGMNGLLPDDIAVLAMEEVEDSFQAMRCARGKAYTYFVLRQEFPLPLLAPFCWRRHGVLDLGAMRTCLDLLVGTHDFNAFKAADSTAKTSVREIFEIHLRVLSLPEFAKGLGALLGVSDFLLSREAEGFGGDLLAINFRGKGFLKYMIRNIVGTVVQVGAGKISVERFREIFASRDRRQAGITAPARGLFLVGVDY